MEQEDSAVAEQQADSLESVLTRLRRVEGQVRGIQRMLEQGRECEEVLTQLTAVRAGLDQAMLAMLDRHVERCVLAGTSTDDEQLRQLSRAMRLIARYDASPLPAPRESG